MAQNQQAASCSTRIWHHHVPALQPQLLQSTLLQRVSGLAIPPLSCRLSIALQSLSNQSLAYAILALRLQVCDLWSISVAYHRRQHEEATSMGMAAVPLQAEAKDATPPCSRARAPACQASTLFSRLLALPQVAHSSASPAWRSHCRLRLVPHQLSSPRSVLRPVCGR